MVNFIKKYNNYLAFLLLLMMFIMGLLSLRNDSCTTDEIAHIPAGYSYVNYQEYRINPEHPPLLKILSAIPLLLLDVNFPVDVSFWREGVNSQGPIGEIFFYKNGNNIDEILFWSRLPILLLAILLGGYLFVWVRDACGAGAALFSLFLFSFSPNILAHARLVTTDLGSVTFLFIATYYVYKLIKSPDYKYLVFSGVFFGLAQLAKFSNVVLIFYLSLFLLIAAFVFNKNLSKFKILFSTKIKSKKIRGVYAALVSLLIIFIIGFLLIGVVYYYFSFNTPDNVVNNLIDKVPLGDNDYYRALLHSLNENFLTKPYVYYLLGLGMVFLRVNDGSQVYFMGQESDQSFWYFYPASFLMKTPISTIAFFIFSIIYFIVDVLRKIKRHKKCSVIFQKYFLEIISLIIIISFFAIGILSNLNIGLRHILMVYPFIFVFIAASFVKIFEKYKKYFVLKRTLLTLVVIYYIFTNIYGFPSYLAYFNEFIGRNNAYKYTVDSNLDWGQDLRRLGDYVEENGINKIKVDFFGAPPSAVDYYLGARGVVWRAKKGETKGWLAVSATYYQSNNYYPETSKSDKDYSWLREYEPVDIIGGSVLIFNIDK